MKMRRFIIALQFLTVVPVSIDLREGEPEGSVQAFPLVGFLQGAVLVSCAYVAGVLFPAGIIPLIVLSVYVLSSGGFHLDGLSDTFDALAKRGDRRAKLEAMKDGRTGAIGATSIVFAVLIKYISLEELMDAGAEVFYLSALLMPALSKYAMVGLMRRGRPAKEEGLGRIFTEATDGGALMKAAVMTFFLSGACFYYVYGAEGVIFSAALLAAVYLFMLIFAAFFNKQFGGLTGDTIGAAGELSEVFFLLAVLLWQRLYIS